MITWIQTRFQTGYKILFFVVLIVVIVAFVFTVGDAPGLGRAAPRGEAQEYFGYNLRSQSDLQELHRLATISFYTQYGQDPGEYWEQHALERLAYLQTARDLGIPAPTARQLQQYVSSLDGFRGPDGRFDNRRYAEYLDTIDAHPRMSRDDVARVFEEDYIIEQVNHLISGPGYAIPHEVRRQVARQKTEWTIEVASLALDDFGVEVEADEEALESFYEENDFRYEVPPHKTVSYVVFETDRYTEEAETPSESEMRDYFQRNRGDFSLPEPDTEAEEENDDEEPREVEFEDVADQVETTLKRRAARRLAEEAASDFTFSLFEGQIAKGSDELAARIDELALPKETLLPYPEGERPGIIDGIRPLDEERYYSDPVSLGENFIVVLLEEVSPSFIPPFEDVRDQVAVDFREEERRRLRAERGNEIHQALLEKVNEGEAFSRAAAEMDLELAEFEPFTLQTPPEGISQTVLRQLQELRSGDVSRMIQDNNRAHFVHVLERQVPEIDESDEDYVRNLEQTKSISANITGQTTIREIQNRAMPRRQQPVQ